MSQDDRLTELEIRTAHQERQLEQFHEVLMDLRGEIARLERELAKVRDRLEGGPEVGPGNEPPPHW